nr:formate--tetrahydrofolate ligase [Lachnospiraceae bacterium]
LEYVRDFCEKRGCEFALSEVWEKGGEGGMELADKVIKTLEEKESNFKPLYDLKDSIKDKIEKVAKEIYGAADVSFSPAVLSEIKHLEELGFSEVPVCMAKTQYSLSDNPSLIGRPEGFTVTIRDVYVSAGAGFIVVLTGNIMTMPGLPKVPAAEGIDVNKDGNITGLF